MISSTMPISLYIHLNSLHYPELHANTTFFRLLRQDVKTCGQSVHSGTDAADADAVASNKLVLLDGSS